MSKTTLTVLPPAAKQVATPDAQMGAQLTTQYHRAVGGMKEVLIFGAMMIQLRELHPELTQRGGDRRSKPTRGHSSEEEPMSLQKWLETYAPDVKRQTAQRFLAVTESISEKYDEVVGAKVAKQYTLAQLVTAQPEELPEQAAAKQLELFDFVNGTSQRSWLDQFVPDKPGGGNTYDRSPTKGKGKAKTAAELAQDAEDEIKDCMNALDSWFTAAHHTRVSAETLTITEALLEEGLKKVRAVSK